MGKIVVILCESADLSVIMASLESKPIFEAIRDSDVKLVSDVFNYAKIGLPGMESPKPKKPAGPKLICNVCNQEFSNKDNISVLQVKERNGEIIRALCHIACLGNADFEIVKVIENKTGKQLRQDMNPQKTKKTFEFQKQQILSAFDDEITLTLDQIFKKTDMANKGLLSKHLSALKNQGLIESVGRGLYKKGDADGK